MKVPIGWLSEYCDPGWEPEYLAERLAMTGTEVERVTRSGAPSAEGFVLGRVVAVEKHPDADLLSVCRVDTGDSEARTIVCGAPNVAADQLVAVALPGAVLPDGTELKRAKLRGVTSDGMILSETELEIGEDADGIMVLADGAAELNGSKPGAPLSEVLAVSEPVLELEVTTNRPDCLSIYGVAREVHAISEAALAPAPWENDVDAEGEGKVTDRASVKVEVPDLCPRFTARVFTGVIVGQSPAWLKARLVAAGQRPINNVVDITNYVMLLTGQPMHAFDLDEVPGGELVIRTAKPGERMTTLDGVEREFDAETVLVCDREGPSGIAGIMGGQRSEVSEKTTSVLLEVANWDGVNILRTSRLLALRSEASARFEKQLHPELAMRGQRIASRLLVELCGARMVPGTIDENPGLPEPRVAVLRVPRVEALIGMEIDSDTCAGRLERLGFEVKAKGKPKGSELEVTVPPERDGDVQREADLIEEVARLADLDANLPSTLPAAGNRVGGLSREQRLRRRAEDTLRDLGCEEIVGWSFNPPPVADRLRLPEDDPRRPAIEVSNPLSEEQAAMRTTLLGSLLDAARANLARGAESVALFESGRAYLAEEAPADGAGPLAGDFAGSHSAPAREPHRLGCLLAGEPPRGWRGTGELDYFAAKGILESLVAELGTGLEVEPAEEPFLHPGRSAQVLIAGEPAGWIGEVHPLVARSWDLERAAGFELDLAPLIEASPIGRERYEDVTTFPAVYEDIAVVVPEATSADAVRRAVVGGAGELLVSAEVFDLYRGEQVGDGRKSVALRLAFRAPDRTLTDDEVAERREAIKSGLAEIEGALRE